MNERETRIANEIKARIKTGNGFTILTMKATNDVFEIAELNDSFTYRVYKNDKRIATKIKIDELVRLINN